jgi:hypothetical protein
MALMVLPGPKHPVILKVAPFCPKAEKYVVLGKWQVACDSPAFALAHSQ